ncbi:MAG: sigma 54-interacting transcriptional regulator, partial [Burkholderiaceae bacterium]|nr:sigma 54-interacting transcriptional regulator [Burkholderiaceae bacterium]
QTRLLRVLQERRITRLGATVSIPIDVRVVAATHQPLVGMIAARQFRQDLYYRLNTLALPLPALRERGGDVGLLADVLLRQSLVRLGVEGIGPAAVIERLSGSLSQYQWPGNVRELENICDRLAVYLQQYARVEEVDWSELHEECPELFLVAATDKSGCEKPALVSAGPPAISAPEAHPPGRRARALEALERHKGHPGTAAAELGISRSTFWRWSRESEPSDVTQNAN